MLFHQRLKEQREAAQLRQQDLAYLVGTSQNQISKYEIGRSQPTADVLLKIAKALQTSSDYLLGLTDDPLPADLRNYDQLSALALLSAREIDRRSAVEQRLLYELVKLLCSSEELSKVLEG